MLGFFLCAVVTVTDGDTFRCAGGTRVRLHAVDTPEIAKCRKGGVRASWRSAQGEGGTLTDHAQQAAALRADGQELSSGDRVVPRSGRRRELRDLPRRVGRKGSGIRSSEEALPLSRREGQPPLKV
jgi:hypothetical protein